MNLFNGYRPELECAIGDSLDRIIAKTRTNEEWDAYWQLRKAYEEIYGIKISTTNWNFSDDEHRVCHHLKKKGS